MGLLSTNLNATLNNPFSIVASTLSFGLSASIKNNNLRAWNTSYSQSIGNNGAIFSFSGLIADAEPKGSLKALGIVSKSYSLAPRIRYPLKRGREESYYVEFGLTNGKSKTTLQSSAITIDKSTVTDLVFSITNDVWFGGSTQLNFSAFHGLDMFGSFDKKTAVPSVANFKQKFTKLKFTANHTLPISKYNLTLKANIQAQWTDNKLLAGEQISFGGPLIGKGYDGGAIAGDKGFGLSFELAKNIEEKLIPFLANTNLELYAFIDYAETCILADSISNISTSNSYLGSHGLGLRINDTSGLSIDLMAAEARNTFQSADARGNPRYILSLTKSF
jgi:hemolysin activation/secretion protein